MSSTDKTILERIAARMKDIVRIAEEAGSHAMKAEKPRPAKKRVKDSIEN
jgi:hypothetical protein